MENNLTVTIIVLLLVFAPLFYGVYTSDKEY
jgi:hypothetical protein